jgi:hypothetical protein
MKQRVFICKVNTHPLFLYFMTVLYNNCDKNYEKIYMKNYYKRNLNVTRWRYFKISPFLYTLHLNFWFAGREHISAFAGAL